MRKLEFLFCFITIFGCVLFSRVENVFAEIVLPSLEVGTFENNELSEKEQIFRFRNVISKAVEHEKQCWINRHQNLSSVELDDLKEADFDLVKLKPWADKLFSEINLFVKNSGDCSAEDFDDYVKKHLIETGGEMNCLDRSEFERFCTQSTAYGSESLQVGEKQVGQFKDGFIVKRVYRGINDLQYVNEFRNGKKYIGGSVSGFGFMDKGGSLYGQGVYTTPSKDYALNGYASTYKNSSVGGYSILTGDVVELAFDSSKAKGISEFKLNLIRLALYYYYPKFCNVYRVLSSRFGFDIFNSYVFCLYEKAYEKVFGRKLINIVKDCGYELNLSELDGGDFDLCGNYFMRDLLSYLSVFSSTFSQELEDLMKNNTKKPHYLTKQAAVLFNDGLLVKLLGFDYLCAPSVCLFVNFGVLTVCREEANSKGKTIEQLYDEWCMRDS